MARQPERVENLPYTFNYQVFFETLECEKVKEVVTCLKSHDFVFSSKNMILKLLSTTFDNVLFFT